MKLVPGDNIGIKCAQSITSSITQSLLNEFHSCGSKKTTSKGLSRLLELLNMTQKINPVAFHFAANDDYDGEVEIQPAIYGKDIIKLVSLDNNCLYLTCDYKLCIRAKLTIAIFDFFDDFPGLEWAADAYYRTSLSGLDLDIIEQTILPQFAATLLSGFKHVYHVENNKAYSNSTSIDIFYQILRLPSINPIKTWSSNIWDVYNVLGIEAARMFLYSELTEIVDPNLLRIHLEILVNHITFSGTMQSISRYSLRNENIAVFTKVSFEESMQNFLNAVFYQEEEALEEMSSTIVVGNRCKVGTGYFDLFVQPRLP